VGPSGFVAGDDPAVRVVVEGDRAGGEQGVAQVVPWRAVAGLDDVARAVVAVAFVPLRAVQLHDPAGGVQVEPCRAAVVLDAGEQAVRAVAEPPVPVASAGADDLFDEVVVRVEQVRHGDVVVHGPGHLAAAFVVFEPHGVGADPEGSG
jgi:hypothetical protein